MRLEDSPIVTSAVLGLQRPREGGAGPAALLASTDYFSLSYPAMKVTAISAEKTRCVDAGRQRGNLRRQRPPKGPPRPKKDEVKARKLTKRQNHGRLKSSGR